MLYQIEMSSFISDFDAEKLFRSLVRSEMNAFSLKVLNHRYEVVIWSDFDTLLFIFLEKHTGM